jgi:hypothetical protein
VERAAGDGRRARPGLDQPLRQRPGVRQRHRARAGGLFARGCEWAATGKVTLELPEAFGEPVPGGDWWPTTLEPMVRDMYEQRKAGGN